MAKEAGDSGGAEAWLALHPGKRETRLGGAVGRWSQQVAERRRPAVQATGGERPVQTGGRCVHTTHQPFPARPR